MSRAQWLAFGSTLAITGCVSPSEDANPARLAVDAAADVSAHDAIDAMAVDDAADVSAHDAIAAIGTDAGAADARDAGAPWDASAADGDPAAAEAAPPDAGRDASGDDDSATDAADADENADAADANPCAARPGTFPCEDSLCCDRATEYCSTGYEIGAGCMPIDAPGAPSCIAGHVCHYVDGGPVFDGGPTFCGGPDSYCQEDDAGAITVVYGPCYGSPPARLGRTLPAA
jgi:hypothetical protein